ncbi:MAG: hypothetical protein ABIL09_18370 [Gemmatimonadota bacterium]
MTTEDRRDLIRDLTGGDVDRHVRLLVGAAAPMPGADPRRRALASFITVPPSELSLAAGVLGELSRVDPDRPGAILSDLISRAIVRCENRTATAPEITAVAGGLAPLLTALVARLDAASARLWEGIPEPPSVEAPGDAWVEAAVRGLYSAMGSEGSGLYFDLELADVIGGTGKNGLELSAALREAAAKNWPALSFEPSGPRPLWPYRPDIRATFGQWLVQSDIPLKAIAALAGCVWVDLVKPRLEDRSRVPSPTLPVMISRCLMLTTVPDSRRTRAPDSLSFNDEAGWSQSVASAVLTFSDAALDAPALVPVIAAVLARRSWEKWQRGGSDTHIVAVPVGRDALRGVLGIDRLREEDIVEALQWLQGVSLGGYPCVSGWSFEPTTGAGRPGRVLAVNVGPPLAPMALQRALAGAGAELPPALRWYAPVLDPARAPVLGDNRTRQRQRAFFGLGLGALFVGKRDEYLELGGVRITPADWRREAHAAGLYHRSHASLADDVFDALRSPPQQADLYRSTGPVLVETESGSGRYRFGPDFEPAHQAVLATGERSRRARARQARQRKGRGRPSRKRTP